MINWGAENISQEVRLENIEEIKNCLIKKTDQNELISKKHKSVSKISNSIEQFLALGSPITGCV